MKNKGFTLIEILLVVAIIGIVTAIALPNIFEAVSESRKREYEAYKNTLLDALKLYNIDFKEDLWSDPITNPKTVTLTDLKRSSPDLDTNKYNGKCTIGELSISRVGEDSYSYTYKVCIECGDDKDNPEYNSCPEPE